MAFRPTSGDNPQEENRPLERESPVEILSAESEVEEESHDSETEAAEQPQQKAERKRTLPSDPAYVSPIPKIGSIPRVPHPDGSMGIDVGVQAPSARLQLPEFVGRYLVGRRVDEYGDIVDDNTGRALARAGGDLPSIVGRRVGNTQGDIFGDGGELLGYVADVSVEQGIEAANNRNGGGGASGAQPPWFSQFPTAKSLLDVMRQSTMPLMVDPLGNILDTSGNVVGKFHDNNNPLHRKKREEEEQRRASEGNTAAEETKATPQEEPSNPSPSPTPQSEPEREQPGEQSGSEKRQNAQSWRKENESPSDIFLDVKSTTEGIQLTIRIPTVFNGSQVRPTVQFS